MAWSRRRIVSTLGLGVLLVAAVLSCLRAPSARRPSRTPGPAVIATRVAPLAETVTDLPPTSIPSGKTPIAATMTPVPDQGAAAALAQNPTPVNAQAVTAPPVPPTLTGAENDQSTWQEYHLLSWGIAFRYPKQWTVAQLAPQTPGDPDIVEVSGGGRTLHLVKQAPGRGRDDSLHLEPIVVGPTRGDKYVWSGPQGQLFDVIIVPQARRDAIDLIQSARLRPRAAGKRRPLPRVHALQGLDADVATAGSAVLEEATGRIAHLYVVVEVGKRLVLAEGGVYSYKFTWPAASA